MFGQEDTAPVTFCRQTIVDVERTVLLPLGQTVQHQLQPPVTQSYTPTSKAIQGLCDVNKDVVVTPISHGAGHELAVVGRDSKNVVASAVPSARQAEIGRWVSGTTITKRELQSLMEKLSWVAKVVKYARAFMVYEGNFLIILSMYVYTSIQTSQ